MSEPRKVKTLKDTNYFAHGTYKGQFKDYMLNIGLANIATRFVLAPLERWRIIKQTQLAYPLRPVVFKNGIDYISRIPKEQGFSAFWRGNLAGIWLYFTQTVIQVGLYDNLKNLQKQLTIEQQQGSFFKVLTQRMFIPLISTFLTQVITFPVDTARVRITMNYNKQKKNFPFFGIRTCLKHLRGQQSFSAMYKGFLLSNAISLINFNLYLAFASVASDIDLGADVKNYINADTIAAVGALMLIHPLDTLKKIVQLNNLSSPSIFKNARTAVDFMKREASLGALYNGILISTIKSLMFLPTFYLVQQGIKQGKQIMKQ